MKKSRFFGTILSLMLAGLLALPVSAQAAYFWFQVRNELGVGITSGVTCHVLTADTVNTAPTIYSERTLTTTQTNPITASTTNGTCTWYGAAATTTFDVLVYHQRGIARVAGLTVNDHSVIVNQQMSYKHIRFAITQQASETDTGIDLPEGAVVLDAIVEVTTAVASSTVDIGLLSTETAGDLDGFVDGVSMATAGFIRPAAILTTGSNEVYFASTTKGVLLSAITAGADVATDVGTYYETPHIVASGDAVSVVYVTSAHAVVGFGHIFYVELANQ